MRNRMIVLFFVMMCVGGVFVYTPMASCKKKKVNYKTANPTLKITKAIKSYEGWYPRRYDAHTPNEDVSKLGWEHFFDEGRDWTIGYGHKLTKNDYKYYWDKYIYETPDGVYLLKADLIIAKDESLTKLMKDKKIKLYQNQFDALVSFTMNHNEHFWIEYKSSAMKDIRNYVINKKYSKKKTKRIFCQYCYSDGRYSSGLKKRRKREATIFNGGKYRGIDNEVIK